MFSKATIKERTIVRNGTLKTCLISSQMISKKENSVLITREQVLMTDIRCLAEQNP